VGHYTRFDSLAAVVSKFDCGSTCSLYSIQIRRLVKFNLTDHFSLIHSFNLMWQLVTWMFVHRRSIRYEYDPLHYFAYTTLLR